MSKLKSSRKMRLATKLLCLIILVASFTPLIANADFTRVFPVVGQQYEVFRGRDVDSGSVGDKDQFPINDKSYNKISFDILYGNNRSLVRYLGEMPKSIKGQDTELSKVEGLERIPVGRYGPELSDSEYSSAYWGKDTYSKLTDSGNKNPLIKKMEEAANTDITSIRLFCLTQSSKQGPFGVILDGFYGVNKFLCRSAITLFSFFIEAKNIDISKLVDVLGLSGGANKGIRGLFNKVFIGTPGHLSIFMIFAIIAFIFSVVGLAFSFAKGKQGKTTLRDLLLLLICGVLVIGMALSGKAQSLPTTVSNVVSQFIEATIDTNTDDDDGNLWKTRNSGVPTSKTIALQEMTQLNKLMIDTEIAAQFGMPVDKLTFSSTTIPFTQDFTKDDKGVYRPTVVSDDEPRPLDLKLWNNNLGYYYWYANSTGPSIKYTTNSAEDVLSEFKSKPTRAQASDVRMQNVVTYLQHIYDNPKDNAEKEKVLKAAKNLAEPDKLKAVITFLLLLATIIIFAIASIKMITGILISKLLVAGSILGLPIAGPLLLTGKPKLARYGKMILFLLITHGIRIVILSIVFDLAFYILSLIASADFVRMILALGFAVAFLQFSPIIMAKLTQLFSAIEGAISPELRTATQATKQKLGRSVSDFNRWNNNRTKTKLVTDADGNIHEVEVKGGSRLLGALGRNLENDLTAPSTTKTMMSLHRRNQQQKLRQQGDLVSGLNKGVSAKTDEILNKIKQTAKSNLDEAYGGKQHSIENLDLTKLTAAQQSMYSNIMTKQAELASSKIPEKITKKIAAGYDLNAKEQHMYDSIIERNAKIQKEINTANNELKDSVKDKATKDANEEYRWELATAASNEKRTMEKATSDFSKASKENKTTFKKADDSIVESREIYNKTVIGDDMSEVSRQDFKKQKKAAKFRTPKPKP